MGGKNALFVLAEFIIKTSLLFHICLSAHFLHGHMYILSNHADPLPGKTTYSLHDSVITLLSFYLVTIYCIVTPDFLNFQLCSSFSLWLQLFTINSWDELPSLSGKTEGFKPIGTGKSQDWTHINPGGLFHMYSVLLLSGVHVSSGFKIKPH